MSISFQIREEFEVTPEKLYEAWLNSDSHSAMTGSPARCSAVEGGEFEAWDGYIQGINLKLEPYHRILQAWRTSEFASDDPDSRLELRFEPKDSGTVLTLIHRDLPAHGMQYKQGWVENYFAPMKDYFAS